MIQEQKTTYISNFFFGMSLSSFRTEELLEAGPILGNYKVICIFLFHRDLLSPVHNK